MDATIDLVSQDAHQAPGVSGRIKTWQIFLVVAAVQILVTWILNEQVMTREVYQNLLADQVGAARADDVFDFTRRLNLWGYVLAPVVLGLRLGVVALFVQLVLLLGMAEVRYRHVFRAALLAFTAVLYGDAIRIGLLWLEDPAQITQQVLSLTPLALSNFMDPQAHRASTYALANMVSAFDVAWWLIFAETLRHPARISRVAALSAVAAVGVLATLFQWGVMTYLAAMSR